MTPTRPAQFFRTTAFRLALVYVGLFCASVAVLFAFILIQPWALIFVFFVPVPAIVFAGIDGRVEKGPVFMATAKGTVKKTPLAEFSRPRPSGIIAVRLEEGDYLVGAALTDGKYDVMLFSSEGKAVRFQEGDVRPMGRQATGVRGMRLGEGQRVVCMLAAKDESRSVLTATANGYGKRTAIADYPRHGRGGQGVIAIQVSERNGALIGAVLVDENDQVMLISTGGVLIRTAVSQIREMGRSTQGVTLISLDAGEKLAGMERIEERDLGNGNGGNGDTHEEVPPPSEPPPTVH